MTTVLLWLGVLLACSMLVAVACERIVHVYQQTRSRMIAQRYGPLIERTLGGDRDARRALIASPPRDRLGIAWLLVPLVLTDTSRDRVAPVRDLFQALSLVPLAERLLRSRFWWRRTMG